MANERITSGNPERIAPDYYIHDINQNTLFVSSRNTLLALGDIVGIAPDKVKKRIQLNISGLNGLATTIVEPSAVNYVNGNLLTEILRRSNVINHSIGLPSSNDLIIRTAQKTSFNSVVKISEPALIIKNAASETHGHILGNNADIPVDIRDFLNKTDNQYYLIIHDDNYDFQYQALHARACETHGIAELITGINTLHARQLDKDSLGSPTIKFNSDNFKDIVEIDFEQLINNINDRQQVYINGVDITVKNSNNYLSRKILRRVQKEAYLIHSLLNRAQTNFGSASVIELRSYNTQEGGVGTKIHLLDINAKF